MLDIKDKFMYNSFIDVKNQKNAVKSTFFKPGLNRFTMKNFNCQTLKHERLWSIAPVSPMSAAFEGYNTPSIQGLDRGPSRGFIERERF
jgi:hypothetical protein